MGVRSQAQPRDQHLRSDDEEQAKVVDFVALKVRLDVYGTADETRHLRPLCQVGQ